jgi:hypothetical protein
MASWWILFIDETILFIDETIWQILVSEGTWLYRVGGTGRPLLPFVGRLTGVERVRLGP